MRAAQYLILTRILEKVQVPEYLYAFEKGRDIPHMAQCHVGKGLVISMDISDFFTSITQAHLQSLFEQLGFGQSPARTLSELCTYKQHVPQGALTSPKVSNLITSVTFGPDIEAWCAQHGFTLTIYADDITISCDEALISTQGVEVVAEYVRAIEAMVNAYGFKINKAKTKLMGSARRQYVCGAVVNQKVNLQKSERSRLRAIVHNVSKNGWELEAAKNSLDPNRFKSKLLGRLNWFRQLNPEQAQHLIDKLPPLVQSDASTVELPSVQLA